MIIPNLVYKSRDCRLHAEGRCLINVDHNSLHLLLVLLPIGDNVSNKAAEHLLLPKVLAEVITKPVIDTMHLLFITFPKQAHSRYFQNRQTLELAQIVSRESTNQPDNWQFETYMIVWMC